MLYEIKHYALFSVLVKKSCKNMPDCTASPLGDSTYELFNGYAGNLLVGILLKFVDTFQFWLNQTTDTSHEDLHAFLLISQVQLVCKSLNIYRRKILRNIDPLLDGNREIYGCTAAVARQQHTNNNTGIVSSVQSAKQQLKSNSGTVFSVQFVQRYNY
jgi:hypothetical protein